MATQTQVKAIQVTMLDGSAPVILHAPEAAGQTYKKGQLVYLVAGAVTVMADDGQVCLGMVTQDATGTTGTDMEIIIATPVTVFEVNVYHSTAASAVTAATQIGENYALQVDSNKCYCDIEDVTNVLFRVIKLSPKDTVADVYGRVWVIVQPNYQQVGQAG